MFRKAFCPTCPICAQPVAGAWTTNEETLTRALASGTQVVCESGAWVHVVSGRGHQVLYITERAQAPTVEARL